MKSAVAVAYFLVLLGVIFTPITAFHQLFARPLSVSSSRGLAPLQVFTNSDMVDHIHARNTRGLTKAAIGEVLDLFADKIFAETMENDGEVRLKNLGVFRSTTREAHKARNPGTQEVVDVPAKKLLRFRPFRSSQMENV